MYIIKEKKLDSLLTANPKNPLKILTKPDIDSSDQSRLPPHYYTPSHLLSHKAPHAHRLSINRALLKLNPLAGRTRQPRLSPTRSIRHHNRSISRIIPSLLGLSDPDILSSGRSKRNSRAPAKGRLLCIYTERGTTVIGMHGFERKTRALLFQGENNITSERERESSFFMREADTSRRFLLLHACARAPFIAHFFPLFMAQEVCARE